VTVTKIDVAAARELLAAPPVDQTDGYDDVPDHVRFAGGGEYDAGDRVAGDDVAPNPILQRMVAATLTTEELKARKPAPMLIDGFLAMDSTAVLFGPSGGNKTFIALDMVLHVATGSWWWGQNTRKGRVVYVLAEGAGRFGKRIDAWQRHHGIGDLAKHEPVTWLTRVVNLHALDSVGAFIDYLGGDPPALIVFDTLARNIVGVEENSARDMGQVIDHLDLIRRHTGACVLLVHHSGLAGGRARGSTALFGSIDTELEVVPDEDRATLKVTKQKDGAEPNPRHFERINVGDSCVMVPVTRDREGLPAGARATLDALATVAVDGGVSTTVWRSATDIAERTFYNHRAGLLQAGLVVPRVSSSVYRS
jgi:hypothetical protein